MYKDRNGNAVVLPTIPHSSTQFWMRVLEKAGVGYTFNHLYTNWMHDLRRNLVQGQICLVPMRHPAKVFRSHKVMGRPVESVIQYYWFLASVVHPFRPFYLPVDTDDRDKYVARASYMLQADLKPEWDKPVGDHRHLGVESVIFTLQEHRVITGVLREFEDVFAPFGYRPEDVSWASL